MIKLVARDLSIQARPAERKFRDLSILKSANEAAAVHPQRYHMHSVTQAVGRIILKQLPISKQAIHTFVTKQFGSAARLIQLLNKGGPLASPEAFQLFTNNVRNWQSFRSLAVGHVQDLQSTKSVVQTFILLAVRRN